MIKNLWTKYKEVIMYLIFGVLTTVVSWLTYALFTKIIPDFSIGSFTDMKIAVANVLSWICAVVFAFITNKLWVFDSKSWKFSLVMKELWLFVVARLLTGVIEWVGVPLLVMAGLNQTIFGIEGMVSKVLVSVIVVILNYVFSKLIVFRKKKNTPEQIADKRKSN